MAITIDSFASYTDRPGINVTEILANSVKYANRIRIMTVRGSGSAAPYVWGVPSPKTLSGQGTYFSAECWGTGIALSDANPNVAIGLVTAAYSGSMIQAWMSKDAMASCPAAKLRDPPAFGRQSQWWQEMILPITPFGFSAVVWHQGEENSDDAIDYTCFQKAMIADWRAKFVASPLLPFVFVQLQPCGIPPDMRYAQAQALALPAVGMASCYDLGDPDPSNKNGLCHSRYKLQCGARLALEVQRLLPSFASPAVTRGPVVVNVSLVADPRSRSHVSIELALANNDGLHWNGTKQCSVCCGTVAYPMQVQVSSGSWKYVNPKDVDLTFSRHSVKVSGRWFPGWGPFHPVALRYAWEDFPQCALYNAQGLPAPPFNVTIPV